MSFYVETIKHLDVSRCIVRVTIYLYVLSGDETVSDVFRDFSNMASHNPEKLKRDRQTYV